MEAAAGDDAAPATAVTTGQPPVPARRPQSAWLGFVGGVACASLIGLLVFWAQRDARPREDAAAQPMQPAPAAAGEHPAGDQLSARDAEALEQLARAIDSDPTDVMARKQYAVGLLSTGQFVPAFEQAELLLASDPLDPDGRYVAGMVRMRMGQEEPARDLLQGLVEDYPDHVPALTALGVLELRAGGLESAEALWDRAIAASGGQNAEIDQLRATARERFAATAAGGAAAPPPRQPSPMPPPAQAVDAYNLRLELAEGLSVPPGAVLFISLRKGDVGPPAAARRIPNPRFPIAVSLSAADSMLGRPLPTDASVWARLDTDGSASTREDGEPFAEMELEIGASAVLTLR